MAEPEPVLMISHTPWTMPAIVPAMTNTVDTSPRIRLTSRHVEVDGVATIPVSGEMHYSRVPRSEWEERLRLMKSGGITVVATYVFWLHHEETRGRLRFEDNLDIASFVRLCDHVGLDVVLRIGPWCHGETRNGGFPDWVAAADVNHRTNDPRYLRLVSEWFLALGAEVGDVCGPLGPIVGIQIENELYDQPEHLSTLKRIARASGLSAPVWTATAWGGADLPDGEVLPLFGGYGDGFWVDSADGWDSSFRQHYFFSHEWDDPGIGADLRTSHPRPAHEASLQFPPATCEIGGGMATAYHRRPRPAALDIAAVAHTKLGSGSAWQGYYMFAGGTNPAGETGLQESHATGYPNDLPRFDYDFAAPIGTTGALAASFGLLRAQHAFLSAFGGTLSGMPSTLPDARPDDVADRATLRWALRSDGDTAFVFIGWHQPHEPLPVLADVRFALTLDNEVVRFPHTPVDIPPGTLATWPVNLDIGGVRLRWATATVLTVLGVGSARPTLVLVPEHDIPVELNAGNADLVVVRGDAALQRTGTSVRLLGSASDPVVLNLSTGSQSADIVVLPASQRSVASVLDTWKGRELVLSSDPLWTDGSGSLVVRAGEHPPVQRYNVATRTFDEVHLRGSSSPGERSIGFVRVSPAPAPPETWGSSSGRESAPPDDPAVAAVYALALPVLPATDGLRADLDIVWAGDVARLAVDGRTVADRFWDGSPWRVSVSDLGVSGNSVLTLSIVPLHTDSTVALPREAQLTREAVDGPLERVDSIRLLTTSLWTETSSTS